MLTCCPIPWGKHEASFDNGEPERYRTHVPNAQIHAVDKGRFALDTAADDIATLVLTLLTADETERNYGKLQWI